MTLPRRDGYVPSASFDIIDFYIDSISNQMETAPSSEHKVDSRSRSSSVYSTDTIREVPITAAGPEATASLQQVFRSLCQVSLHTANLRHARDEALAVLDKAEERVDTLARRFLLTRLGSIDQVDRSNQAIDTITNILLGGDEGHQDPTGGQQDAPEDADFAALREAVGHAKELRAAWNRCRRRLEAEQRVLLWPTLEQWRRAVACHQPLPDLASPPSASTAPPNPASLDSLDRVTAEMKEALPRMGRRRLEHMLGCITAALRSSDEASTCMPDFI